MFALSIGKNRYGHVRLFKRSVIGQKTAIDAPLFQRGRLFSRAVALPTQPPPTPIPKPSDLVITSFYSTALVDTVVKTGTAPFRKMSRLRCFLFVCFWFYLEVNPVQPFAPWRVIVFTLPKRKFPRLIVNTLLKLA